MEQKAPQQGKRTRLRATKPTKRASAGVRLWLYKLLVMGIILLAGVFFAEALLELLQDVR